MATTSKQLGQLRPADTNAASIYSPAASTDAVGLSLKVCNTTGTDATCRVFHDDDGTTYDETTALFYDVNAPANQTLTLGIGSMDNDAGNIAVRSSTSSALTFTLYGTEMT